MTLRSVSKQDFERVNLTLTHILTHSLTHSHTHTHTHTLTHTLTHSHSLTRAHTRTTSASRRQCTPHTGPPAKEVRGDRPPLHSPHPSRPGTHHQPQSPNGTLSRTRSARHESVNGGRQPLHSPHPSRPRTHHPPQATAARVGEAWGRRRTGCQLASDGAGGSDDGAASRAPEARHIRPTWPPRMRRHHARAKLRGPGTG